MNKKRRLLQGPLMYLLLLAVILSVVWMLGSGSPVESVTLSYSDFLEWVQADLRADKGEKLTGKQADMTIDRIIIQENTLYGLKEDSKIPESEFPGS